MVGNAPYMLLDTFDDFLHWWRQVRDKGLALQVESWSDRYMAAYPELRRLQVEDYAKQGHDWREIAAERVLPLLEGDLGAMKQTHAHLLEVIPRVCRGARQTLGMDFVPWMVLYVGIGCGAGWATRFRDRPACLLGLEMIAQCNWHTPDRLEGLLAHELGHLLHMTWRDEWEAFTQAEDEYPLFLLYSEGFAQRCEQHILGRVSWHQDDGDWLGWCQNNLGWLAGEFVRRLETGEPVRDFFGSWYELRGRRQTGYFLGHAWIEAMEEHARIRQVALWSLEEIHRKGQEWLRQLMQRSLDN